MKEALELEGAPFVLFGGEPLLVPIHDLEELWRFGLQRFGRNGIQTNGSLITERHLDLFELYRVQVGISIDGPGDLNSLRWHGSEERTEQTTQQTLSAIDNLCLRGNPPSLILTLHSQNATSSRLPILLDWIKQVVKTGVRSIRLHLLESESEEIRSRYGLKHEENIQALLAFLELEKSTPNLRFDLFSEMRSLLQGDDLKTTCVWYACDPYTTKAVRGVEGQGQRSNCGRTNKDGIDFVKASSSSFERYLALYQTPQEYGGCQACRYFLMCKGHCPGTAIDNDWRNRTEHCSIWKTLFRHLELELEADSLNSLCSSASLQKVEAEACRQWSEGRQFSMHAAVRKLGLNDM